MDNITQLNSTGNSQNEEDITHKIRLIYLICSPILALLTLGGAACGIATLLRPAVRCYSSAIYLSAIFILDLLAVFGDFFPPFFNMALPDAILSIPDCRTIYALSFIGRIGCCFLAIFLTLDRVLALSNPARFYRISQPWVALVASVFLTTITIGLSGPIISIADLTDDGKICIWHPEHEHMAGIITSMVNSIVGITFLSLLALNVTLIVLIRRKMKQNAMDPIQSSLRSARSEAKQMNRVNLLVFIVTLFFIGCNLAHLSIPFVSMALASDMQAFLLYVAILRACAFALHASRFFVMLAVSPSLRREAWAMISCDRKRKKLAQERLHVVSVHKKVYKDGWDEDPIKSIY